MFYLFDFYNFIKKNFLKKKKFLIGYSGGLDSTVLLYNIFLFKKQKTKYKNCFRVIHINHNINKCSNNWSYNCYIKCKKWNFNLIIVNLNKYIINIYKKYGGIEASARHIRNKIFNKYLLKDEILLLGHHLQDKAENFFLSLKRSSGPRGLSGIKFKSTIYSKLICRPMLNVSKDKIYSFAVKNNLSWDEDSSNKDCYFDRNYIRKHILPVLRKKWPYIEKSISKSAFLCFLQEKLLIEYLEKELKILMNFKNDSLYYLPLLKMSRAKQYYILRLWINKIKPNIIPSYKFIYHLLKNVIFSKIDSNPILKIKNFEIRKFKNYLYLLNFISKEKLKKIILPCFYPWKDIILPYKLGVIIQVEKNNSLGTKIRIPINQEKIFIKFAINTKVLLINKNKTCKLNKFFKEKNIPPWLRWRIPLLFYNNKLIASPNFFVCKTPTQNKEKKIKIKNFYLQWIKPKLWI